jgi:hypothetical protein
MSFVVVWLVCMIITALVASSKNRSPIAWALLAIPLGLIATVVVACSSKLPDSAAAPVNGNDSESTKTCPRCAENVKAAAQICRFCGHQFVSGAASAPQLPWTLEEDWGNGFGVYRYKGEKLAYSAKGVAWKTSVLTSPELAIESVDTYMKS